MKKTWNGSGGLFVAIALVTGGLKALPVLAEEAVIEEVVVTGSRIKRSDAYSISPISVMTSQELNASGNLTLENFIQDIPFINGGDLGSGVNNGNPGIATASLRGLGPNRTLILLNGKRPSSASVKGYVDLNMLPTAIVERIEVLRDGASTVYGSDAIAGVINIITKKNFEGVDIDLGYDVTDESDGRQYNASLVFGNTFDQGNFVFGAQVTKRDEILQGNRGFSECPLSENAQGQIVCGGSPVTTPAMFVPRLDAVGPQVLDDGASRSFDPGRDGFNFATSSYLATPMDVFSAYAATNYQIIDSEAFGTVTANMELNYSNRESDQRLAAVGTFWGPLVPSSNVNNPFGDAKCASNPQCTAPQSVALLRRMTESGGRAATQDVNSWRISLGLDGELVNGWDWDLSYTLAKWAESRRDLGRAVRPRIDEMLDPALCAASVIGCPSVWNPFVSDSMTAAQVAFGFVGVNTKDDSTLNVLQANISGDAGFELPGGVITWALGYENRRESAASRPDGGAALGAVFSTPGNVTEGRYQVDEFYGELVLPLLANAPFAKVLNLEASARWTDVDFLDDSESVYKLAMEWAPLDDVRFRATFAEGFRAPNISELFLGQQQSAEPYTDPCRNYGSVAGLDANTIVNCQADGLAGDFNLGTFQVATLQGGNPDLEPETSESFTFGIVIQPSILEGLTITLDYFDIEIENAIGTAPSSEVVTRCYASAAFSDPLCALIVGPTFPGIDQTPSTTAPARRNSSQQLSGVLQTKANLASYETKGIDFMVDYGFELGTGYLGLRVAGTYLKQYNYLPFAGGDVVELAGKFGGDPAFGNSAAFADWQVNYTATYTADSWGATLTAKYMAEVDDIAASAANLKNTADSVLYFDVNAYYQFSNITLSAGVRNLTDEEPPYVTAYDDINTLQFSYDTQGRYLYTRAKVSF